MVISTLNNLAIKTEDSTNNSKHGVIRPKSYNPLTKSANNNKIINTLKYKEIYIRKNSNNSTSTILTINNNSKVSSGTFQDLTKSKYKINDTQKSLEFNLKKNGNYTSRPVNISTSIKANFSYTSKNSNNSISPLKAKSSTEELKTKSARYESNFLKFRPNSSKEKYGSIGYAKKSKNITFSTSSQNSTSTSFGNKIKSSSFNCQPHISADLKIVKIVAIKNITKKLAISTNENNKTK